METTTYKAIYDTNNQMINIVKDLLNLEMLKKSTKLFLCHFLCQNASYNRFFQPK